MLDSYNNFIVLFAGSELFSVGRFGPWGRGAAACCRGPAVNGVHPVATAPGEGLGAAGGEPAGPADQAGLPQSARQLRRCPRR